MYSFVSACVSQIEAEWEDLQEKYRKVQKQNDRLQRQYDEAKEALHAMKQESADYKGLRMANEQMKRDLRELEKKLGDLEQAKNSASKRISELKTEKRLTEVVLLRLWLLYF